MKTSLVDYPGEPSFVIFLGGCNFKCPFCHNQSIVFTRAESYLLDDVLMMLFARKKFLNAVVISGGEPTIWGEQLKELIIKIKSIGFKVKLDTNGSHPELIKNLIDMNLLDFIAMDIKNSFLKYNETCGVNVNIDNIKNSIKIIEESKIDYQFRTTLNKTMHTIEDIKEIKTYLKDTKDLKLQTYKYSDQQIIDKDFGIFDIEDILDKV